MEPQTTASSLDSDAGLFDIMYSCRAMRRFKPDPVPEDVLGKLVESAAQAPSSSNNQCWHFVIVRDRDTKARMSEQWQKGWAPAFESRPSPTEWIQHSSHPRLPRCRSSRDG